MIKFTGFSCLLAQCWYYRASREHEMKQLKRKCLLRLNKFSGKQRWTNFAFCNLQAHSHAMWYLDWAECRKIKKELHLGLFASILLIFRVFTSVTSSTFSFSSLFSLQVMQWRPSYASSTTPSTPCPPSCFMWWSSRCSSPTFPRHISAGSAARRPTSCWSYTACCSSSRPILPTRTAMP